MTNGASGDINNLVFTGTRAPRLAVRASAHRRLQGGRHRVAGGQEDRELRRQAHRRRSPTRSRPALPQAGKREIILAEGLLKKSSKERNEINKRTTSVANRVIEYSGPDHPETEPVLIQAVRIGEQAIVSMPFEVLVEIGLEIKEKSPIERTFLISLANGGYGYLPPPNQHKLGATRPGWAPRAFNPSLPTCSSSTSWRCSRI